MLTHKETSLALKLTPAARQYLAGLLAGQAAGSLPALFYASESQFYAVDGSPYREAPPRWYFGVYTRDQIEQVSRDFRKIDRPLVYAAMGVSLCIPQAHLVDQLQGRTLDVQDGQVSIR